MATVPLLAQRLRPVLTALATLALVGGFVVGGPAALATAAASPASKAPPAAAPNSAPPAATGGYCATSEVTVPAGVTLGRMTVVGQRGVSAAPGPLSAAPGGDAGIVQAVVVLLPGQKLWLAGASTLMRSLTNRAADSYGVGGRGSFISTVDPNPYCPGGNLHPEDFPANAFLAVAGGGGGGGQEGNYDSSSRGGPGGAAGTSGVDAGDNERQDGGGGAGATTTRGGSGGAAGHRAFGTSGDPGAAGSYLTGGAGGRATTGATGGSGGAGLYGGGGGGGGQDGGSGGGGGGSNYLPAFIPSTPPATARSMGTLQNGTTKASEPSSNIAWIYPTTTTITVTPTPSYPADELTASVAVTTTTGVVATGGDVDLQLPGRPVQSAPVRNGVATFPLGTLPVGATAMTANYRGIDTPDAIFQSSQGTLSQTVTALSRDRTVTTVALSASSAFLSDPITLTSTVADSTGVKPNGGSVTFIAAEVFSPSVKITLLTAPVVDGKAQGSFAFTQARNYSVTAVYSGFTSRTEIFDGSTSAGSPILVREGSAPDVQVQPQNASITYGDKPPTLHALAGGLPEPAIQWERAADSAAQFSDIPGATSRDYAPPADTPTGTQFRAHFENRYGSTASDTVTLTVAKAHLLVIADDTTIVGGTVDPDYTVSYGSGSNGFRLNDGPASLQGSLTCVTDPPNPTTLAPGRYPITCSGLSSPNYIIDYQSGSLTVTAAAQKIEFTSEPPAPGLVGQGYRVEAEGGGSGQPVLFSATASSAPWCTVSPDGDVQFVSSVTTAFSGTCTINADQAAKGIYPAAPRAQQIVDVQKVAPVPVGLPFNMVLQPRGVFVLNAGSAGSPAPRYQWFSSTDGQEFTPVLLANSPSLKVFADSAHPTRYFKVLMYNSTGLTPSEGRVFSNVSRFIFDPVVVDVVAPDLQIKLSARVPTAIDPAYSGFLPGDTPASLGLKTKCTIDATVAKTVGTHPDAVTCSGFSSPDYTPVYHSGTLTVVGRSVGDGDGDGAGSGGGSIGDGSNAGGVDLGGLPGDGGTTVSAPGDAMGQGAGSGAAGEGSAAGQATSLAATGASAGDLTGAALLGAAALAAGLLLRRRRVSAARR